MMVIISYGYHCSVVPVNYAAVKDTYRKYVKNVFCKGHAVFAKLSVIKETAGLITRPSYTKVLHMLHWIKDTWIHLFSSILRSCCDASSCHFTGFTRQYNISFPIVHSSTPLKFHKHPVYSLYMIQTGYKYA